MRAELLEHDRGLDRAARFAGQQRREGTHVGQRIPRRGPVDTAVVLAEPAHRVAQRELLVVEAKIHQRTVIASTAASRAQR